VIWYSVYPTNLGRQRGLRDVLIIVVLNDLLFMYYLLDNVTPLGQLPMMEVDSEKFSQSMTIFRYVARQTGL
jgi:hypothetical protein